MSPLHAKLLGLSLLLITLNGFASKNDQSQPYYITADQARFYRNQHQSVFTGHVTGRQGSSKMSAEKARLYLDNQNSRVIKVEAVGKPARFSTLPDNQKERLDSQADIINYNPITGDVILKNNASVTKGKDRIYGSYIEYNVKTGTMLSNKTGKRQQTTIIIHPDSTTVK